MTHWIQTIIRHDPIAFLLSLKNQHSAMLISTANVLPEIANSIAV